MHRALGNTYIKEIVCMDPKHIDNVYMVTPELQTGGIVDNFLGYVRTKPNTRTELTRVQGELNFRLQQLETYAEIQDVLVDARFEVVDDCTDFYVAVLDLIDNGIEETREDTPATSVVEILKELKQNVKADFNKLRAVWRRKWTASTKNPDGQPLYERDRGRPPAYNPAYRGPPPGFNPDV
jgi:hypothetical protein